MKSPSKKEGLTIIYLPDSTHAEDINNPENHGTLEEYRTHLKTRLKGTEGYQPNTTHIDEVKLSKKESKGTTTTYLEDTTHIN